jgi:hypothetical protein
MSHAEFKVRIDFNEDGTAATMSVPHLLDGAADDSEARLRIDGWVALLKALDKGEEVRSTALNFEKKEEA